MGLKATPGKASVFSLVLSSLITIPVLLMLIGGHFVIVLLIWSATQGHDGIQMLVDYTHFPKSAFVGSIVVAIVLDILIGLSSLNEARKKKPR